MSEQWFLMMEPLANKALEALENGDLRIIPERFEKVFRGSVLVYWYKLVMQNEIE